LLQGTEYRKGEYSCNPGFLSIKGAQIDEKYRGFAEANVSGERVTPGGVRTVSALRNKASRERAALGGLKNCTIAVIGDLMLDRYLHGDVHRISPEAPVPVVQRRSERHVPGGAANVVSNLATLGVNVHVVGITGADETRTSLIGELQRQGRVVSDGMIIDTDRPTTQKLRIVSAHQQIARIDFEDVAPLSAELEDRVIGAARTAIAAASVVIVSDYGKGLLTDRVLHESIAEARRAGKPVLVDPKRRDWSAYRGASIVTPNRRELSEATGLPCETDEEAAAAVARARLMCGADILLTRSEKGMSFFSDGKEPIHVPTVALEVFDVSGAGDTVIAIFAAGLAIDMEIADALKMANYGAGIVVAKFGTATVTVEELLAPLNRRRNAGHLDDGPLVSRDDAVALRKEWARQGLTVGLANGCFDLLHPGHISLIRQAAGACDRLIVALNSDASVKRLKGQERPVQNERSRATVIGAIKGVSAVTIFGEDTPLELLQALEPDVLVKGADYAENEVVGADLVKARGGRIVLATLVPGQSTSSLIEREKIPAE
jgi:D-beta-D-heptose 7-phosphate kinase/D-beta-D-heptose 1-phosphate adenosyltransferase